MVGPLSERTWGNPQLVYARNSRSPWVLGWKPTPWGLSSSSWDAKRGHACASPYMSTCFDPEYFISSVYCIAQPHCLFVHKSSIIPCTHKDNCLILAAIAVVGEGVSDAMSELDITTCIQRQGLGTEFALRDHHSLHRKIEQNGDDGL